MKKLLLACMLALGMGASAQITAGSGNTTNSNGPWSSCWGYSYHQQIYTKPMINAAGTITSLTFKSSGALPTTSTGGTPNTPQGTNNDFKIYIGHTTKSSFTSNTDWEPLTNLTLVYDGPITMPTVAGADLLINLTTPFVYNNTDNLIIAFDENTPGYACTYTWVANSSQTNMNIYSRSDTVNPDPSAPPTGTRTSTTPQVVLGGLVATSPPSCVSITAPANAATGISITPTISWPAAGGASSYELAIGTTAGGTDVMPLTDVGNVTSYVLPVANALAYSSTYYVTVYPKNGLGTATACTSNMFTTAGVTCPTVTLPTAAATGVSLTPSFTWNAVTGATSYTITIGTTSGGSDILNNVDVGNVTTWVYTGPALANNTQYFYTINALVGGATSASCTVRNFTTICSAVMAPYTYDVENAANTTSSVIGNCWSSNPSGTTSAFRWDVDGAGSTPSSSTGPSGAKSGVKYFYTEASSGATGAVAELYSPFINVTALTNPTLQFYYHMYGSTMGELHVDVYDGAAWINDLVVLTGQQQTAMADPWALQIVDLSSLTITGNIQVRFRGIRGTDFYGDMSIDDISIIEAPTCLPVSNLMVNSFTSNSAMISWTAPSTAPANGYEVYYSTVNTDPTATTILDATNSVTSTTATATISGLTANTVYYFWVRSVCSATERSGWTSSATFTTACSVFVPNYTNNFSTFPGACWSRANDGSPATVPGTGTTNYWLEDGFLNVGSTGAAKINLYSTNRNGWLISPAFDLSAGGYRVKFDYGVTAWNTTTTSAMGSDDVVQFVVSTDGGATWTVLQTWDAANAPSNTTNQHIYDLTSYTGTNTIFALFGSDGTVDDTEDYDFFVDNFVVETIPVCDGPSGLTSTTVTDTTATISWMAPATVPANGYEYVYSTTNTAPTGSGTSTTATSVPLSTLSPSTTYYYWVRSNCGGSTSTWVSGSFTTLATPPANDDCSGAVSLTPGATFAQNPVIGTTIGATLTNDTTATTACQQTRFADTWYSVVVPASGSITIETKSVSGSAVTDTVLGVYSGSCGTLTSIECDDDDGDGNFSMVSLTSANGITPGQTLLIGVWNYSSTNNGAFQVSAYDASLSTSEAVITKNEVKAYPNPFSDVLNISDIKNVKSISVIDLAGRVVKSFDKPSNTLQLSELNSGMYLVVLNMNDGTKQTLKAIKK